MKKNRSAIIPLDFLKGEAQFMIKDPYEKKKSEEMKTEMAGEPLEPELTQYLDEDLMDEYDKWF